MESIVMGAIMFVIAFIVLGLVAACCKVIVRIIGDEGMVWVGIAAIVFVVLVMMS